MAKIDITVPEKTWLDVCRALELKSDDKILRCEIGDALGNYKNDIRNQTDTRPGHVRKILLDCNRGAQAFLKSFKPIATLAESGPVLSASFRLSLGPGCSFTELNDLLGRVNWLRIRCRALADELSDRGGPIYQNSRSVLIARLDRRLAAHKVQPSTVRFSDALRILMKAAGSDRIPSEHSLEKTVREARRILRTRAKRK